MAAEGISTEQIVELTPAPKSGNQSAGVPTPAKPDGGGNQPQPSAPPSGLPFRDDESLVLEPDEYAELQGWRASQSPAQPPPAPEPAPAPVEPVKPSHPSTLVEHARILGIPAAEIESLPTAELRSEVDRAIQVRRLQLQSQPRQQPQPQQQQQLAPPVAPPTPQELVRRLGLDPEELEPGALEIAAKMAAHYEERFAKLEAVHQRFQETEAQQQVRQNYRALDSLFAGNAAVFGSVETERLDQSSPEFFRRQTVLNNLIEMQRSGRHGKSLKDDFDSLHATLFGFVAPAPAAEPAKPAETKQAARDPETGQFVRKDAAEHEARQRAWMDGASPSPTDRTEEGLPPGVEKMARGIERWYRMRGEQPPVPAKT